MPRQPTVAYTFYLGEVHASPKISLRVNGFPDASRISDSNVKSLLWSSVFVTLVASKFVGLLLGVYWSCQIMSRVFYTAPRLCP
jgi:hypothetical protein